MPSSQRKRKLWSNQHRNNYQADPRDLKILEGVMRGLTRPQAAIAAGYGKTYARCNAVKLYERAKRLVPINMVNLEDLGNRATQRLWELVDNESLPAKETIPACRLAFELCGKLGQSHLHEHQLRLPAAVEQMLMSKMKENQPRLIDATVVSENSPSEG